jgi:hypothetical protein
MMFYITNIFICNKSILLLTKRKKTKNEIFKPKCDQVLLARLSLTIQLVFFLTLPSTHNDQNNFLFAILPSLMILSLHTHTHTNTPHTQTPTMNEWCAHLLQVSPYPP